MEDGWFLDAGRKSDSGKLAGFGTINALAAVQDDAYESLAIDLNCIGATDVAAIQAERQRMSLPA
jgi:hypothetical protein